MLSFLDVIDPGEMRGVKEGSVVSMDVRGKDTLLVEEQWPRAHVPSCSFGVTSLHSTDGEGDLL